MGRFAAVGLVVGLLASPSLWGSAIPWWKQFDPDLTVMQNPTIKTLYSDDFSLGFLMTGISEFRDFNTLQTTAIGARFDSAGDFRWGAFLDGGAGSGLHRVVGLTDLEHFFAGYVSSGKVRVGVYHGVTLEKRFAHEFDMRAISEFPQHLSIELYSGDVIGVVQHLDNGVVHVMLLDGEGKKLVDRDYSGLTDPGMRPPDLRFQRLPDRTGFLLVVPNHVVCLNNDGGIRWARAGLPFTPGFLPPAIGPDGSVVFTTPGAIDSEGRVAMIRLNGDGSFAWARMIEGLWPELDMFMMGRNPINDGENIWLTGTGLSAGGFSGSNEFVGLVRIDAASGDIISQADISIEDRLVFGEFVGWTGTHALFSIDSANSISPLWRQGNLLRVDGNLENPELLKIHTSVETTRVSYDAAADSLLYTSTDGNGRWIRAASLDATTLEPGGFCEPPIEPVAFTYDFVSRESVVVTGNLGQSGVTSADVTTAFVPTDLPLALLTLSEENMCVVGGEPLYFAEWANEIFGSEASDPAISGPDVDLTGDGVTNLQAYAFGLNPLASNDPALGMIPAHNGEEMTVTFRIRGNLPVGTFTIEGSYDLIHWDAPVQVQGSPPDANGMVTATARLGESSAEATSGFLRLRIANVEP